jgi:TRAP-type C4-dicarboxylate transport system permease small subunit
MRRWIDKTSDALGIVAAWIFFLTGVILTYEALSRNLLNAPTVWVEEVAQIMLIAGVYLAVGRTVHRRQNIRIDALYGHLGGTARKVADTFSLLFMIAFAMMIVSYGSWIAWDSYNVGRSTGSMMNFPNWWSEALVPVGFLLLILQASVELSRIWTGGEWGGGGATGNDETGLTDDETQS